jgi:hypothetical protein
MSDFKRVEIKRETLAGGWRGWVHRENGRIILTTKSFADSEVQCNDLVRAYKEHGVMHSVTVDMRGE